MLLTVSFICAVAAHSQKKCSDKSITVEFQKVKEKQEARKIMLQKTQQDGVQTTSSTTNSSLQTKQLPITKPSSQPMMIPKKKNK